MCECRFYIKMCEIALPMLRAYSSRATQSEHFPPTRAAKSQLDYFQARKYTKVDESSIPEQNEVKSTGRVIEYPKRIFSGIQPTGSLHLGNYLGAMKQWIKFQNDGENTSFCIVDLHSITLPQKPDILRSNILQLAATIFASGIDPDKSTVFVQSAVKEHSELCWILSTQSTVARLGHLPQYKEKSKLLKEIPLGLYLYPVLQAADICLYKSTHIPVGEDQLQHIQLAQHIARNFNTKFGPTFPICQAIIEKKEAARIKSLRDPLKKMSKSDPDPRATINLLDEPEVIVEKFKKALTDFTSDVTYDVEKRPGVSNIMAIHSLITGETIDQITVDAAALDTARYKLRVADAVIEHLKPIRSKVNELLNMRTDLVALLENGALKSRQTAAMTMEEVRSKMGIGTNFTPFLTDDFIANEESVEQNSKNQSLTLKKAQLQPGSEKAFKRDLL